MVRLTRLALAASVLSGCVSSLPQAPSAVLIDPLNPAFSQAAINIPFAKRATTTTTKKTTSSSTKKTTSTSTNKTTSSSKTTSTVKTTSTSKSTSISKTTSTSATSTAIPSVTNTAAFTNGAGNNNNANTADGTGKAANDVYTCYSGAYTNFPPKSQWLSFGTMWNYNKANMYPGTACQNLGYPVNDNLTQIQQIYQSIQAVAEESLVDHRFILAILVQESLGCVYVNTTISPDGTVRNPGIMQSHNGSTYNVKDSANSIKQMIRDGTEGTAYGDGLVQLVNKYGNIYAAARGYNSGTVDTSDLGDAFGAVPSYVSDIGNRLTGWLYADRKNCTWSTS